MGLFSKSCGFFNLCFPFIIQEVLGAGGHMNIILLTQKMDYSV
jgi:hypothetical protein